MDGLSRETFRSDTQTKGILKKKNSKSSAAPKSDGAQSAKTPRFNEENIKETYRPANKDYGFDKITEPNTPYERDAPPIDPIEVSERLLNLNDRDGSEIDVGSNAGKYVNGEQQQKPHITDGSQIEHSESLTGSPGNVRRSAASTSSDNSLSFEEKRKKHIQAEFIIAKQAAEIEK